MKMAESQLFDKIDIMDSELGNTVKPVLETTVLIQQPLLNQLNRTCI